MAHDSLPSPLSPPHSHAHLLGHHLDHTQHTHAKSPPSSPVLPPTAAQHRYRRLQPVGNQSRVDIMSPPPPSLANHQSLGHNHKSTGGGAPTNMPGSTTSTAHSIPQASQPPATASSSAPSSKPLWREPVHLVALVHFCELTGPSIVFVSQPVHGWEVTELAEIHDPILPPPTGEPPDPALSASSSSAIGSTPASSADVGGGPEARSRTTTSTSTVSASSAASSDNASAPAATAAAPSTTSSILAYAHHPPTAGPNGAPLTPSAPMCPACHPTLPSSPAAIADLWSICTHAFPSLVPTHPAPSLPSTADLVPVAAKPALVSPLGAHRVQGHTHDPNPLLVASARYPLRVDLYPVLKSASVRSLSCEVAPSNRAGPLLYTLEVPGFALPFSVVSQAFSLADAASRGGVRAYALLFLTNHAEHVTQWWDVVVARFGGVVNQLVALAEGVSSGSAEVRQQGDGEQEVVAPKLELSPEQFLKKRGNPLPRIKSLVDIVGVKTVFISLHLHFAALLRDTWIACSPSHRRPAAGHQQQQHQACAVIHGVTYPIASPRQPRLPPTAHASSSPAATPPSLAVDIHGDGTLTPPATPTAPSTCMSLASTSSSSPARHLTTNHAQTLPRHLPPTTSATDPALTVLFHLAFHLPRPDLLTLLTHLATGDQIIVRGACDLATPLLHALAYVLPDDCATVVENSPTYRESWECNLLGVDSYVALPLNTLRENGAGYCVVDVDEVSVRVAYDYLPPPAVAVTGGAGGAAAGAQLGAPGNPRSSMVFAATGAGAQTGAGAGVAGLPSVSRIAADVARAVDGAKALAGSQWLAAHPCLPPTVGSTTGAAALLGSSASTSSLRWAANTHHHRQHSASSSSETCLPPRVLSALRLALGRVQTTWLARAGDFAAMVRRATLYASTAAHVPLSPFATAANPATAVVGALVNPESAVPMALAHSHVNVSEWSIGSTGSGASGVSHYSPQGGGAVGSSSASTAAAAARPIVSAARAVAKQASLLSLSSLLGSSWRKNSSSASINVSAAGPGASSSSAAHVTASILSSSPATVSGATGKQYLGNVRRAAPTAHPTMGSSGTSGAIAAPASLAGLFPSSSMSASASGAPAPAPPPYISTGSTGGGYASGSSGALTPSSPLSSPFTESGAGEVRFRDDLDVLVLKFWGRAAKRRGYGAVARSAGY